MDTSNLKPSEYATAVRNIINNISVENVSFLPVMIFRYSDTPPKRPTGGSWIRNDYSDEIIPPTDWYLDLNEVEDISLSSSHIYMSTCIFKQDGTKFMSWTSPVRISGKNGKDGKQGEPGQPGNIAGVVIEYNTPIYTVTTALTKPEVPFCTYDIQNQSLIIYTSGWSRDTPDEDTLGSNVLWQSVARYNSNSQYVLCSNPVRISAGNPDVILSDGFWTEYCFTQSKDDPKTAWFTAENADPPVPTLATPFLWARNITKTSASGKHVGPVYLFATYVAGLIKIDVDYTCAPSREIVELLSEDMWFDDSFAALTPDKDKDYPGLTEDTKYLWAREQFIYSNKEPDIYYRIVSTFTAAEKASIIYSAGTFNEKIKYTRTEEQTPYVFYPDGVKLNDSGQYDESGKEYNYFVLKYSYDDELHEVKGENDTYPSIKALFQIALEKNTKCNWEKMESFSAVYSDVGVFKAATVGQFVFDDKYIFSQYGINNKGESVHYTEFVEWDLSKSGRSTWPTGIRQRVGVALAIESGHFTPNVLIDAQTGDVKFGHGTTFLQKDGQGFLAGGNFAWTPEGHVLIGNEDEGKFVAFKDGNVLVSGDITLGAKSSGLGQLQEWIDRNKAVDDMLGGIVNRLNITDANVVKTQNELLAAQATLKITNDELDEAQKELESAQKLFDDILWDTKINKYEVPQIKDELQNVEYDYKDIQIQKDEYELGSTELYVSFNNAYENYKGVLEEIIAYFEDPDVSELNSPEALVEYYNAYYESRLVFLRSAIVSAKDKVAEAQTAANNALTQYNTLSKKIDNLGNLSGSIDNINKRLDGTVMQYTGAYKPEFGTNPYLLWVNAGDTLLDHVGDIFINTEISGDNVGRSWQWYATTKYSDVPDPNHITKEYTVDGIKSTYYFFWKEIIDQKSVEALNAAKDALDLADGKRRVFVDTPIVPYDEGDLWLYDGDLLTCKSASKDVYNRNDWTLATKYTDDQAVTNLQNALDSDTLLTILEKRNIRDAISSITTVSDPNGLVINGVANGDGSFKTVYDELISKGLTTSAENVKTALAKVLKLLSDNNVWTDCETTIDKYFRNDLNNYIASYSKLTTVSFIPYTHTAYADDDKGTGFTLTDSANKNYFGQYSDYNSVPSTVWSKYKWTKIKGEVGASGTGISSIINKYGLSTSNAQEPSSWYDTPPSTDTTNKYLWHKQTITLSEGSPKVTTQIIGTHGSTGSAGRGIAFIVNYYYASDSKDNYPSVSSGTTDNNWWSETQMLENIQNVPNEVDKYLFRYTKTIFTNNSVSNTTPIIAAQYAPGGKGDNGKIIYPAGKYSPNITYTSDDEKAPYVLDGEDYYVLKAKSFTGYSGGPKPSTDSTNWTKFDKFEAIYAKLALIDNGTIGDAVFNDRYMFSKTGINSSGGTTEAYDKFSNTNPMSSSNAFRPNFCVDFKTGQVWLNAGKTVFNAGGSGQLGGGGITWDNSGVNISNNVKFTVNLEFPFMESIHREDDDSDSITDTTWAYIGTYPFEDIYCQGENLEEAHIWIPSGMLNDWITKTGYYYNVIITPESYDNTSSDYLKYAVDHAIWCDGYFAGGDPLERIEDLQYDTDYAEKWNSKIGNITDKIQSTEISGDKIKTGTIDAKRLNVKEVAAEMMRVGALTVDQLNTTPLETTNAGRVLIEDNDISIFNNNSEVKAVSISGSPVTNLSNISNKTDKPVYSSTISAYGSRFHSHSANLMDFSKTLIVGNTYVIRGTFNCDVYIYPEQSTGANMADNIWNNYVSACNSNREYCRYYIYYFNRELTTDELTFMGESLSNVPSGCVILQNSNITLTTNSYNRRYEGIINAEIEDGEITYKSGYKLYVGFFDTCSPPTSTSNGIGLTTKSNLIVNSTNYITFIQQFDCTELGSDGIQLMSSSENFIKMYHNGAFELNTGNYQLKIDSNGIQIGKKSGSTWKYKNLADLIS